MHRNTTLNLPDKPIARPKAYASADDPLLAYSQGSLSRHEAIRTLKLRDYAELLIALGDADLPMPSAPPQDIENQATTFTELWRQV